MEVPLNPGRVPKATVFSDDLELTVKAWEVRSSPELSEDSSNKGSVAFSVLGIHGKIGSPKEILGANATDKDAPGLEGPSLRAGIGIWTVGVEVCHDRHGGLANTG